MMERHETITNAWFTKSATDKWDAIEKLVKSNQAYYGAVAIFDSILEHGYTEEIHNRMIKRWEEEHINPDPPKT
jgi:hypothetical protein